MNCFLYENHCGSPTLTLVNALGVLGVLNVLNVLNIRGRRIVKKLEYQILRISANSNTEYQIPNIEY